MMKPALVCGVVAVVGAAVAWGEEFPLAFHTIPAKDAISFPGGYVTMGQLRFRKPARLKNEPKPISRHAVYGECRDSSPGPAWIFRLDESKGDGEGYDQILVDVNGNDDLTDDAPAPAIDRPAEPKARARSGKETYFGPIQGPPGKVVAGGRPVYFALAYLNDLRPPAASAPISQNITAGYVRFKPGWYVDAAVEFNGVQHKVGIFDEDGNERLGDLPKPQTFRGSDGESWYFRGGDAWLIDLNGSGKFEGDELNTENCPFGPLVYLGATPYKATLTADGKALQVEPWTAGLAEVTLQPRGDQVCRVTLAWEQADKQWRLIRAGTDAGKIQVPPGHYRVSACELMGKAASGDPVMALGYQWMVKPPVSFTSGKSNTLRCGAPLDVKASATKRRAETWELAASRTRGARLPSDSDSVVAISARVRGADGEVYAQFAKGQALNQQPALPTFTVVDPSGTRVGDGKLEFG